MMRTFRKITSFVLVLVMLLAMMPQLTLNASAVNRLHTVETGWIANPMYPEVEPRELPDGWQDRAASVAAANGVTLSWEEAADYVRQQMANRVDEFSVRFQVSYDDPLYQSGNYTQLLMDEVFAHTGEPKEGDYLWLHYGGGGYGTEVSAGYNGVDVTSYFNIFYYTNAAQEQELDLAIEQLLQELALDGKSDYEKTTAIYRYITANVRYDWEHLNDYDYLLQYTAYGALINGTAVCQGYANLLYRLLLEAGVDNRCVTGSAGGPHVWNIIRLGELYYNADATWDEGVSPSRYGYFLKGSGFNRDHFRDGAYTTAEFHAQFPTSERDFDPNQTHTHTMVEYHIPATCTTTGYTEYRCACGYSEMKNVEDALGHDFGEWDILKPATCTTRGMLIRNCARCGNQEAKDYLAEHNWDDGVVTEEPSDGFDGTMTFTCQTCGATKVESMTHVHSYTAEIIPPGCQVKGYTLYTCACGDSYIGDEVMATGHQYQEIITEATCTEVGTLEYECIKCWERQLVSYLDRAPCNYERVEVVQDCVNPGYVRYTCTVCHSSYSENYMDPLQHEWYIELQTNVMVVYRCNRCQQSMMATGSCSQHTFQATVTEPNCVYCGYTTYQCSDCWQSYTADYVAPLGHRYTQYPYEASCTEAGYVLYQCSCGDWYRDHYTPAIHHHYERTTIEPTCSSQGYSHYYCGRCGDTFDGDYTDPLPHSLVGEEHVGTCMEYNYTIYTCEVCGYQYTETSSESGNHLWGQPQIRVEPTITKPGLQVRICTVCGDEWEEEIPATGLPFVDVAETAYYYQPVFWALEHGITAGTDATHFSPDQNCTRGQVVTFLWRAAGCPAPAGSDNPFIDVPKDAYYHQAVLWAVEQGITAGVGGGRFAPEDEVTRAQFVTFLWRWAGKVLMPGAESPFTDVEQGAYYADAVLWAVENKITAGTSATTFGPEENCTRGQVVTFLYRNQLNQDTQEPDEPYEPVEPNEPSAPETMPGVYVHEDWAPALGTPVEELPAWNDDPSLENILQVLSSCDPDGAVMFRWDSQDAMIWMRDETEICDGLSTAIHETYHGFSYSGSSYRNQMHYLGQGNCLEITETETFRSQEMVDWIPEELRTFRFDTYVGAYSDGISSNENGIYGLMNEFNAYWMSLHHGVVMFDYHCGQEQSVASWRSYFVDCENGVQAYAEFRYYILTYLLYAQENYPELYQAIMDNLELRYVFTVLDQNFAADVARYFADLDRLDQGSIQSSLSFRVTDAFIWMGNTGLGRMVGDYELLMAAMESTSYQNMLEQFYYNN